VRGVVRERDREAVLRFAVLRGFAAAVERFAVERFAVARLGAALLREADAPADFALVARAFVPLVFARDVVLRAAAFRRAGRAVEAELAGASSVTDHLPDITRCAASATASAISDPSLVALAATLLAACCAVSAASSPASRIARRAFGLALIAAAAAASPAASISLLIAAFVNLSTVLLPDEDDRLEVDLEDAEELFVEDFLGDFAIAFLSLRDGEDTLAT
jgi:hypothetical protein